jgi:exopolysaccharide biosynthesis polyprenyl glycosylphosphotransferase
MIKLKQSAIFIGDIIMLYGALAAMLLIRYGGQALQDKWQIHVVPFSFIFVIWILIFYLEDLYKNRSLSLTASTVQTFFWAIGISFIVSIASFYLLSSFFQLTPKTNLVIFAVVFAIFGLAFRFLLSKIFISGGLRNRVIFIGDSPIIHELAHYFFNNPQLGYYVASHIKEFSNQTLQKQISDIASSEKIDTIVVQSHITKDPAITKIIYRLLSSSLTISDLASFYEITFQKVPLEELEESWFIEKLPLQRRFYDTLKRILDLFISLIFIIITSPLILLIAILIKISSRGPAIFKQERIGRSDVPFILYKFRTMRDGHEGPLWTEENDSRLTKIGKVLRFTHLDELPQLYNIVKGNISFVGPRPERRELVEQYSKLPYYEMRHTIKPGLTGWAQINFGPSASLEEALEKLKYDMYYIKNRSLALDFLIVLKTLKMFLFNFNN